MKVPRAQIAPYLAVLKGLPFVDRVTTEAGRRDGTALAGGRVQIHTPTGTHVLPFEVRGTLRQATARDVIARMKRGREGLLLFAPYVPTNLAHLLADEGVQYVDLAGNHRLALGRNYFAHVEGRRAPMAARQGRGLGPNGYRVIFAILVRPQILDEPIRAFAELAGVPKTVVGDVLRRLEEDRTIGRTRTGRTLLERPALLNRWLTGYGDLLRPRLMMGRFVGPEADPNVLDKRLARALPAKKQWAWGGTAAAYRLTGHYRGDTTVLHTGEPIDDLPGVLGVAPATNGPIIVLRAPGPLAFDGTKPRVAHPLLVYTELLLDPDPRARAAARVLIEQYPQ